MDAVNAIAIDRYDKGRAWLADRCEPIIPMLDKAGTCRDWWEPGRTWKRTYGRFDPGADTYCTLVYETGDEPQRLCLVEVMATQPPSDRGPLLCLRDTLLGWVCLSPFILDSRLTTLPELFSRMTDHEIRVLRYRPQRRCTLRVVDAYTGDTRFAKVFADDRGHAIHKDSSELWSAASRGELEVDVAEPGHWDDKTRTLWQAQVSGKPVISELFSDNGADLARRMGRACASISECMARPANRFDHDAQLKRTARYASELVRRFPPLSQRVETLTSRLERDHRWTRSAKLRPIHGAPHAHQWLDTGARLGLVDFDRFCLGDPELDVATFIAEMDYEDPSRVPIESINQAFLHGYESVAGPVDKALLRLYRTHKHIAKSLKAARAVRPDADGGRRVILSAPARALKLVNEHGP